MIPLISILCFSLITFTAEPAPEFSLSNSAGEQIELKD